MVDILIKAFDRNGLLRDITSVLANEKSNVYSFQTDLNKQENMMNITVTVEIDGLNSLSRLLARIGQVSNVLEVRRKI